MRIAYTFIIGMFLGWLGQELYKMTPHREEMTGRVSRVWYPPTLVTVQGEHNREWTAQMDSNEFKTGDTVLVVREYEWGHKWFSERIFSVQDSRYK